MANGIAVKAQRKQPRGRVGEPAGNPRRADPGKPNPKHDQLLALLKNRYGYTNEKAVNELERLLKQFYKMNRSLGIPGPKQNFQHPRAE